MKKVLLLILAVASLSLFANAADSKAKNKMRYQAVPMQKATIVQKGDSKNFCPICGMTLPMFYKTNHAASHKGENKQYCSIHCLAEDQELNKNSVSDIKVVDNKTLKLINAKKAIYVVGSNKPATMSMVSKYAFLNKKDALIFQQKNGGELKSFDEVYSSVAKGMKKEKAMILKRQGKMEKMGKKVYTKMCKKTDKKFENTSHAKTFINKTKLCGKLKGKKLQAVGIYLGRR